jgi:seryl-tRNA synthetase
MLTLKYIQENKEQVINRLQVKNFDASALVEELLKADQDRREFQKLQDSKQAEIKQISKEIGKLFQAGKIEEANSAKEKTACLKEEIKLYSDKFASAGQKVNDLLVQLPNVPHESVPQGKTEADNIELRSGGHAPDFTSDPVPHWDLAKKYNLIDFELGNKLTGAGFPVYIGKGARLQRALINFFLDENLTAGYTEVLPPFMVNEDSGFGTGQLPDKEGQMYHVTGDNLYLIPTAEVPVTNIYRDVILTPEDFPIKNTAYTPCFRREAGSYGKDVRGLNRLHQFDKVEIVQIQHPDKSYDSLNEMVQHVESIIQKLGLEYRILQLCGGDISFTSALTYDFEVFSAAQEKWLEVSSVSNFESFQSNRLKLRFKEKGQKKPVLAHTLNGSALALPRIMAAIIENYQTPNGIAIPEPLVPYTGFSMIS